MLDFPRLATYLANLAANNDRAWFEANRTEYQALRDDFAVLVGELIAGVGEFDDSIGWVDPKDCIFRIHRDVRFSRNKSPYKTTFAAVISDRGRRHEGASYYFQVNQDGNLMAGGGVWMPPPERLALIRAHVAEHPERLQAVLDRPGFESTFGGLWDGDRLKRPPAGFSESTPMIDVVKLKSFIVERDRDVRDPSGDPRGWVMETFRAMHPFILWLREALAGARSPIS